MFLLLQVTTVQKSISSLGVTSGTQLCEAPGQGAQCVAWIGNLKVWMSPKGCQHAQSTFHNKDSLWAPGNAAHHLPSIMVTLPTMGNTC